MRKIKENSFVLNGMIFFMILILPVSCATKVPASTNYGTVMDVYKDHYANVVLKSDKGKADYNTWINIYFPMKIERKDDIVMIPKRYLDSLINETQVRIMK